MSQNLLQTSLERANQALSKLKATTLVEKVQLGAIGVLSASILYSPINLGRAFDRIDATILGWEDGRMTERITRYWRSHELPNASPVRWYRGDKNYKKGQVVQVLQHEGKEYRIICHAEFEDHDPGVKVKYFTCLPPIQKDGFYKTWEEFFWVSSEQEKSMISFR